MPRKSTPRQQAKPARKAASGKASAAAAKPRARKVAGATKDAMVTPARKIRQGFIAHTEIASNDPDATRRWCEHALGWSFLPSMDTPQGAYHMWSFGDHMGGGIRDVSGQEAPGAVPYVEVKDIRAAFDKALKAGASAMMPPEAIPGGMGAIAVVQAPGGPAIGFWSDKL